MATIKQTLTAVVKSPSGYVKDMIISNSTQKEREREREREVPGRFLVITESVSEPYVIYPSMPKLPSNTVTSHIVKSRSIG